MPNRFEDFFFTSNETQLSCPRWGDYKFQCIAPKACATGPNSTNRQYCCSTDLACFSPVAICANDGSTFNCTNSVYSWCCVSNEEHCPSNPSKINICISTTDSVLLNVSESVLNKTYSSLSSAQPSASSYSFDPYELEAQTQTTSTTSASSPSPSSTSSSSPIASSSQTAAPPTDQHSLSGGAIAGVVLGILASLVILASFVAILLKRRTRSGPSNPEVSELSSSNAYTESRPAQIHSKSKSHEMGERKELSELPSPLNPPTELPASPS